MSKSLHPDAPERKLKIVLAPFHALCYLCHMLLGMILRKWRESERLSLRDVANLIGVQATALSRFERGKNVTTSQWAPIVRWMLTTDNNDNNETE